jgi:DNA (cytosine-5)-methyltransferase 1
MDDIWGGQCNKKIGYTLRVGGRRSGINDWRNWDSYSVDGELRVISSNEGLKMMGFPETFKFSVSETQAMKQLGNSVAINAVQATGRNIINYINDNINLFENAIDLQVA